MKEQIDKFIVLFIVLVCFGVIVSFRSDHDMLVFFSGAATSQLGSLTTLVRSHFSSKEEEKAQ